MAEYDNKRLGYLRILLCYTVLEIALILESLLLGWEIAAVILLLVGLAASWMIHITETLTPDLSVWLYFVLAMLSFFYYGMHETSVYDLAPVMIVLMLLMSGTEKHIFIRLCTVTYFFTMIYALLFIAWDTIEPDSLSVTRTMLHFLLVCIADWLAKVLLQERKRLREAMNGKIGELEEGNHKMENFLVNVSHELRTPINAIMGFTSVMLNQEKDESKRRDIVSIQKAGRRLFDQIEGILDYTEIDTGKIKVTQDAYMISSVVNDIVMGRQAMEDEGFPEIIFDVEPTIPARLIGDGRKIKKILRHLIDNAVKFTPQGAVLVEIFYLERDYGINLCIRVTDTGIGIKQENIKKLSGKFYQQNGERNRSAGGLGLGLPVVYGIVSAMGGFVKIASREGEGTVVSVSIPQRVSDAACSISVEKPEELCVACYLKPDKYQFPEIRRFYNNMIFRMAQGLHITLYRVESEQELTRILSRYRITHLFIGKEEYADRPSYYEELGGEICVAVVTDDVGALPADSRVNPLKKPFYFLPIVDLLGKNAGTDLNLFDTRKIICPGVRALIVDDELMNLKVAEGILKNYHMQVKTVNSGKKAVEICGREEFDLVFLDHMMPEMDGVDTLKQLRRNNADQDKRLTVIAFTANAVSGAREMFLQEGFDEFISKPVEMLELDNVLKKVLPRASITYLPREKEGASGVSQTADTQMADIQTAGAQAADTQTADAQTADTQIADAQTADTQTAGAQEAEAQAADGQTVSAPEDELAALERGGFHTQSGLAYCQGDKEFYKQILAGFAKEARQKEENMRKFSGDADWENYRILAHSMKSTAKLIGADELSGMAKAAEDAAREADADYIRVHEEALLLKYRQIAERILDTIHPEDAGGDSLDETDDFDAGGGSLDKTDDFGAGGGSLDKTDSPDAVDSPAGNAMELTGDEFKNYLLKLRDCLDTFEADKAAELLAEIEDAVYGGRRLQSILHEIIRDVESFELSAALDKTKTLIGALEGGEI